MATLFRQETEKIVEQVGGVVKRVELTETRLDEVEAREAITQAQLHTLGNEQKELRRELDE